MWSQKRCDAKDALEAWGKDRRKVVVTNQSGIGRGYFDLARLDSIHGRLRQALAREGVRLDGIYFCPHHPDAGCNCQTADFACNCAGMDADHCPCCGEDCKCAEAATGDSCACVTGSCSCGADNACNCGSDCNCAGAMSDQQACACPPSGPANAAANKK